jgi:CBS domain-containing protein
LPTDAIISTLSASDVRGFDATAMALLARQSVVEFLQAVGGDGALRSPLMGTVDMTVKQAAKTMLAHKVHRLWISPSAASPRGAVVSYTDIIRAVYAAEYE